jgi:hypothetical protein
MTMLADLLPCITRQRPGVDTIRDGGVAEREVVRCSGRQQRALRLSALFIVG